MPETLTRARVDYEEDFHAWLMEQAALARAGRADELDLSNIAEELESLGRSDRREIYTRLTRLLEHLLKLAFSPDHRPRQGSIRTVDQQRHRIGLVLRDSPSLAQEPARLLGECHARARRELGMAPRTRSLVVPETCPFTIEQVLDIDFVPEAPGGD